jgi:hypothetical protein
MTRREEREWRALEGRLKSPSLFGPPNSPSIRVSDPPQPFTKNKPVVYPMRMPLHCDPLQYPNTPKSTPLKVASGIPLTTGVEMMDMSRRMKAIKSKTVKGVAGLSMMDEY